MSQRSIRCNKHGKDHSQAEHRGPSIEVSTEHVDHLRTSFAERIMPTHRSSFPARSMEDPPGSMEPMLVHGPLIDEELA